MNIEGIAQNIPLNKLSILEGQYLKILNRLSSKSLVVQRLPSSLFEKHNNSEPMQSLNPNLAEHYLFRLCSEEIPEFI
jgi:hypothetical protein